MNLNNLNNLNLNEKIEDLLATLKKKEDEYLNKNQKLPKIQSSGYWRSSVLLQQLQESHLQYIVSLLRIIWKILKKISMMILMITSRMKKSKQSKQLRQRKPGLFYCKYIDEEQVE